MKEKKPQAEPAHAALLVELWPIEQPIPYEHNARTLTDRAVATVAASIREFGWRQPIVVDQHGVIIVGHTRLLAAQQLGLKEIPVHIASDLTPAQARQYRLMDNRTADETAWNKDLLSEEIAELQKIGLDLALTGFDPEEIAEFTRPPADENAAADSVSSPAPPAKTATCPSCGHVFPL